MNKVKSIFIPTPHLVSCLAFSFDGRQLAAASHRGAIRVFDLNAKQESSNTYWIDATSILGLAFTRDGTKIVCATDASNVIVKSLVADQTVQQLRGHTDSIVQVLMSPTDGNCTLASASLDTMIRIWNLDSGDCLRVLQGHAKLIRCISFSRDGSQLASGSDDGTVRLWNVASDACQVLRVPNAIQINTIKLAKTSLLTLTVDRQTNDYREDHPYSIRIWDIASKECLCNTPAARNTAFAFSNDGKSYSVSNASGDSIGCSASVFATRTNQCISTMHGHSRIVRSIVFSLCGNSVATTSDDKTIAIWSLIDFVGLCQIVLPMLESGVAPYVALDIVDFLLAAAATHASFASRSEFMHFRKISVVDALRQRMKEKLVLSRE